MNAIILTAVWGIVMMFGGAFFKQKSTPKYWAIAGLILAIIANCYEILKIDIKGIEHGNLFPVELKDMLAFDSFNLVFITVVLICTLFLFLLNGRDIEKVGTN